MRSRIPIKYVVINGDRLWRILSEKPYFHAIDRIKFAILHDLVDEGCTMCDTILIFEKYAIDYYARKAVIEIKESVNSRHEIPEEIFFVTCQTGEERRCWDNYDKMVI